MTFLTPGGHPVKMRITSFECNFPHSARGTRRMQPCNPAERQLQALFSFRREFKVTALTQANIQAWKGREGFRR
jgi:hypothetical protein